MATLTQKNVSGNNEFCDAPLKLLIHNVSHSDFCLILEPYGMARPRSSRYKAVCDEIINVIKDGAKYIGITFKDKMNNNKCVGFEFTQKQPLESCEWSDFRMRSSCSSKTNPSSSSVYISKVFFPLLSVIIPKWISQSQNISFSPHIRHIHPQYNLNDMPINNIWESDGNTKNENSSSNESMPKPPQMQQNESSEIEYYSSDANDANVQTDATEEKYKETMEKYTKKRKLQFPISNNSENVVPTIYKLFLVSGAGHSSKKQSNYYEDDSTQQLAALLCHFISDFYPQVKVKQFYSGSNIFHYLENIKFVHSHLRPAIDYEREKLAKMHGKIWQKFFSLSLSLCDGTPARLSAIIEGLRSFEPNMLHMFRKKTLWTNYPKVTKLWEDDFEFLQFAEMITYPAIPIKSIQDQNVINMVQKMKEWRDSFMAAAETPSSEMSRFWLRKTHQPVLAILSVQKPNDEHVTYYKGVNVEVSMPTGSLCAERNAIGTALANDPSLRREHFKMVAVLFMAELEKDNCPNTVNQSFTVSAVSPQRERSYVIHEEDDINPRGPCGSCMEWLTKIAQCNPSFKVITFASRSLDKVIVRNLK